MDSTMSKRRTDDKDASDRDVDNDNNDDPQTVSGVRMRKLSVAGMPKPTADAFAIPSRKRAPDNDLSKPGSAFKFDSSDELPILQVLTKKAAVKRIGQLAQGKMSASPSIKSAAVEVLNKAFTPESVPQYVWSVPEVNPAEHSWTFCDILMNDAFIDKSAALHYFLNDNYSESRKDFYSVPLRVVYPRRFAKTTFLQFIEALVSPAPELEGYTLEQMKTKIASLEFGKELLSFGMHPVLYLDMQEIASSDALNNEIVERLKRAGLEEAAVEQLRISSFSPVNLICNGVKRLNKNFERDFGVKTKTILLIDEHDILFRNKEIVEIAERKDDTQRVKEMKQAIAALMNIFALGKQTATGISLLVLCGRTRTVEVGLSSMNNIVDVSSQTKFHGLGGVSTREFVKCCSGELSKYAKRLYGGTTTLEDILKDIFIPKWEGFRFGVDKEVGILDPDAADGALFSPMDVWEIVQALAEQKKDPSSKWMETMSAEFEFINFHDRYKSSTPDGFAELARNLLGGWVDKWSMVFNMQRENYRLLILNARVKRVLLELWLLSVKRVGRHEVLLGSPNWSVTKHAMRLLVDKTHRLSTPQDLANRYLSDHKEGFTNIVSGAKAAVTRRFRATMQDVFLECPFQDFLFMQLFYRFPDCYTCSDYELYKELPVSHPKTENQGSLGMGVALLYADCRKKAFIIKVKITVVPDAAGIAKAQEANVKEATAQVQSYEWNGATVDEVQRVVVSGVWYPRYEGSENYGLNAIYRFVHP